MSLLNILSPETCNICNKVIDLDDDIISLNWCTKCNTIVCTDCVIYKSFSYPNYTECLNCIKTSLGDNYENSYCKICRYFYVDENLSCCRCNMSGDVCIKCYNFIEECECDTGPTIADDTTQYNYIKCYKYDATQDNCLDDFCIHDSYYTDETTQETCIDCYNLKDVCICTKFVPKHYNGIILPETVNHQQ